MADNSFTALIGTWLKKPYDDSMTVTGWFLFIGMLAVLTFLWTRILRAIAINA